VGDVWVLRSRLAMVVSWGPFLAVTEPHISVTALVAWLNVELQISHVSSIAHLTDSSRF
jgi:hypothetical protein